MFKNVDDLCILLLNITMDENNLKGVSKTKFISEIKDYTYVGYDFQKIINDILIKKGDELGIKDEVLDFIAKGDINVFKKKTSKK